MNAATQIWCISRIGSVNLLYSLYQLPTIVLSKLTKNTLIAVILVTASAKTYVGGATSVADRK